ncbi:PucR family transcriptional regulator [Streptomyces californicus]
MHVEHLLQLPSLDLTRLWGGPSLLAAEIGGVTATDLEDPARFLRPGEIVLSGLVWWSPDDGPAKADRFVAALRSAGAVALLAGEETHGSVPGAVVDACRVHRIPLLAVPSRTSFRAVTEAVYLRQWGDLSRRPTDHYALPENVRTELGALLADGADPGTLLDRAFAHLGGPAAYLLSATGRTLAATPDAPPLPRQRAAGHLRGPASETTRRVGAARSPYAARHLHVPVAGAVPPRVLHEMAEVLAQHRLPAAGSGGDGLLAVLRGTLGGASPRAALEACGLPREGPFQVVTAELSAVGGGPDDGPDAAADALAEALHLDGRAFRVAASRDEGAVAVAHGEPGDLAVGWAATAACAPGSVLHGGASGLLAGAGELAGGLRQARFALTASRTLAPAETRLTATEELRTLDALLAGLPAEVRAAYSAHTLGPLMAAGGSRRMLLETLETFLAHNGSWARTAEALHLHVNTVHYRVQRIEQLTGRDLARLDHRLDLRAALSCR